MKETKNKGLGNQSRWTPRYREWRTSVLLRDGNSCVDCGSTQRLHAHHIKAWAKHKDLRYDVTNGQTLCAKCHQKHHKWINRNAQPRYSYCERIGMFWDDLFEVSLVEKILTDTKQAISIDKMMYDEVGVSYTESDLEVSKIDVVSAWMEYYELPVAFQVKQRNEMVSKYGKPN